MLNIPKFSLTCTSFYHPFIMLFPFLTLQKSIVFDAAFQSESVTTVSSKLVNRTNQIPCLFITFNLTHLSKYVIYIILLAFCFLC